MNGNGNYTFHTWIAIVTLLLALLASYIKFDREVQAKPSEEHVARMLESRVNTFSATFAEILRRLERIERQQDQMMESLARQGGKS